MIWKHFWALLVIPLLCPRKTLWQSRVRGALGATCEGVDCCGWESWINSPWLPMSVRASKNWYYWHQNPFSLLHLGKAWNVRINSISSHSAWARTCRATCEGVGCCGWESWINSPWLSMSVRAIPIRNQKKMHGWDCIFWLLQHRSSKHWATRELKPCCCFLDISLAYYIYPT